MQELHALQECKVVFEPVKIGTAAAVLGDLNSLCFY
ncbi:hypothetical protein wTkk_000788 [Wolbachia endosymbiont of Trichogramma kaykai]